MRKEAIQYVERCTECQQHKWSNEPPQGSMKKWEVSDSWLTVGTDAIIPLLRSKTRSRYIYVKVQMYLIYGKINLHFISLSSY